MLESNMSRLHNRRADGNGKQLNESVGGKQYWQENEFLPAEGDLQWYIGSERLQTKHKRQPRNDLSDPWFAKLPLSEPSRGIDTS
jgi:hypothetical protein